MRRSAVLIALAAVLLPAGSAAAQDPPPAAAPPAATLTLAGERDRTVLSGKRFSVGGRLRPAVEGEGVTVRVFGDGRELATRTVPTDATGAYRADLNIRTSGRIAVRAEHAASPALGAASAGRVRLDALPTRVGAGQGGARVRLLQRHLRKRGYVVGRRGSFDARTARAVLAFRKVSGLARRTSADRTVMRRLADGGGYFKVRYPGHGKHIEADLSRQVMALMRGRKVERIYPVSSGAPATPTIRGHFRFYLAQPGYNNKEMYFSKYFRGNYAIHGYKSVPTHPASHGCLRAPIPDAKAIYDWIEMGDRIDVYR